MSTHLIKLHRYKLMGDKTANRNRMGVIQIDAKRKVQICRELVLGTAVDTNKGVKLDLGPMTQTRKQRKADAEWQMFSPNDTHSPSPTSPTHGVSPAPVLTITTLSTNTTQATPSSSLVEYSMPEAVNLSENLSECRLEFDALTTNLKNEFAAYALSEEFCDRHLTANWRLQGTLVAHLHEHRAVVTRMTPLRPFGSYFGSVSIDGTVRLWDCNKLDGQQSINRSRQSYAANTPLNAIAACDGGQSLAVAGKDGTLLLLRIDPNSNKMALQQVRNLDTDHRLDRSSARDHEDGPVVDMSSVGAGGMQSMIVYATLYGAIVGWDIRTPDNAWRLESDLRNGVITSLCIDPTGSWLAVGTSSGRHIIWDLRFKLPIAKIKHPHDARIRRVACHPTESSWLISASQGNNEVFVWNIETGHRQAAFWASSAPPLSNPSNNASSNPSNNSSSNSVGALLPGCTDTSGFVLTGGTDQRIRHWDVEYPENCSVVVAAPKDQLAQTTISYE
jgi:phosphoinositide-3-kinase, regulatory subunit 4